MQISGINVIDFNYLFLQKSYSFSVMQRITFFYFSSLIDCRILTCRKEKSEEIECLFLSYC